MKRITELVRYLIDNIKSQFEPVGTRTFTVSESANDTHYGISALDYGKYRQHDPRGEKDDE